MSDSNDQRPDSPRTPPSTEQLRIVGAEEAGTLVGRNEGADPESPWGPRTTSPRATRRAVFESIPDAADAEDFPLSRSERWASAANGASASDSGDPGAPRATPGSEGGGPEPADDITVLGTRPAGAGGAAATPAPAPAAGDDPSHELELPHWTAPPTGQVPSVLVDESRKDDSWSTFASAPRWRGDANSGWDDDDVSDVADLAGDEPKSGALDDRERPAIDEFFSFDVADDSEPTPRRRAGRRSQHEDRGTGEHRIPAELGARRPVGAAAPAGRNVPVAVALGVGLAALALALFRIGPGVTMVFVLLILGVGAAEFFDAGRRGGYRPATLLGLAASIGLPAAVYWRGDAAFAIVGGLTILAGLLWFLFGVDQEQVTADLGVTLVGVAYVGGLGAFAALILRAPGVDSTRVLLGAVVPVVAHDVLGYVVGRNAGRTPLMAHVSPAKTVEGLLGGALGAVIASVVFNQLLGSNPWEGLGPALALGLVVAVMSPLGDLAESLLKRDLGIKDMGTILPGHGGVLDRFDAMLFTLPAAYFLALALDVVPG
jgi:phosphatidate cytidylyltransferase